MIGMSEGEGKKRWNPTAEQVRILERVYREGNHRPTTMEIHHITHLLSRHGSVQGINVFYWFKNRKSRDKRNMPTMTSSALRMKWGGLKLNSGDGSCDHIHFISTNLQEVNAVIVGMNAVCHEAKDQTEEKPLQTLQLFPPSEK